MSSVQRQTQIILAPSRSGAIGGTVLVAGKRVADLPDSVEY